MSHPPPKEQNTKTKSKRQPYVVLELVTLFFIVPLILYLLRYQVAFYVLPLILIGMLGSLIYLFYDTGFDRAVLLRLQAPGKQVVSIGLLLFCGACVLSGFTAHFLPELYLVFPSNKPVTWLVVLILYPLLAALPQEVIFRVFFMQRYRTLFANEFTLIFINGLSFGLYHLFYANWYAPIISMAGGWLFAYRYLKSNSLVLVSIEHGLWGNLLFTVGLGWYFYSGSIQ